MYDSPVHETVRWRMKQPKGGGVASHFMTSLSATSRPPYWGHNVDGHWAAMMIRSSGENLYRHRLVYLVQHHHQQSVVPLDGIRCSRAQKTASCSPGASSSAHNP